MPTARWRTLAFAALFAPLLLFLTGRAAAGPTDLQQTEPLVWVMIGLSVAGAVIVYAFLAYALWKFRDPHTKGRKYG